MKNYYWPSRSASPCRPAQLPPLRGKGQQRSSKPGSFHRKDWSPDQSFTVSDTIATHTPLAIYVIHTASTTGFARVWRLGTVHWSKVVDSHEWEVTN
jgi:hypothetical protein